MWQKRDLSATVSNDRLISYADGEISRTSNDFGTIRFRKHVLGLAGTSEAQFGQNQGDNQPDSFCR